MSKENDSIEHPYQGWTWVIELLFHIDDERRIIRSRSREEVKLENFYAFELENFSAFVPYPYHA